MEKNEMLTHREVRWAILSKHLYEPGSYFPGRFCWADGDAADPCIRTFRTREEARQAKKQTKRAPTGRVVKVTVTVRLA